MPSKLASHPCCIKCILKDKMAKIKGGLQGYIFNSLTYANTSVHVWKNPSVIADSVKQWLISCTSSGSHADTDVRILTMDQWLWQISTYSYAHH
jgi:hypothetical protein